MSNHVAHMLNPLNVFFFFVAVCSAAVDDAVIPPDPIKSANEPTSNEYYGLVEREGKRISKFHQQSVLVLNEPASEYKSLCLTSLGTPVCSGPLTTCYLTQCQLLLRDCPIRLSI